ncbi:Serine/threonine-protein kinase pkn1 [Pontiella desulfatans]|uniref:Serine/threonine-protein kinase pkn1 n=1 Tax=Pontiella desulfatans TaxID=2750659 RepID=A0A6C2U5Q2_PONDE|nr:SUMF1/EgtB/PvdO family nonheme iron enzyme [Pontiella desulfatans]VGO15402.1 Serine/threonine-protein kinase pkn1 [Pontiella desulfatans]
MKKWCVWFGLLGVAFAAWAVECTIDCEKDGDHVSVSLAWNESPTMGYTLKGRPSLALGDWLDLTAQIVDAGQFQTNLPGLQYFFRVDDYLLSAPSDGMMMVVSGTNSGTDPDFGAYALSVDRFWIDSTEITKEKWDVVAQWGADHGYKISTADGTSKTNGHPVVQITYVESILYCNARSEMEGLTPCYTDGGGAVFRTYNYIDPFTVACDSGANGYRLPTNDEWEYAARAGLSGKRFPWGNTISHAKANYYAWHNNPLYPYDLTVTGDAGHHRSYWFNGDVSPFTAPVGDLPANAWGLYNMAGNVAEFTNTDGAFTKTSTAIIRGGSYFSNPDKVRCGDASVTAGWLTSSEQYGFRTVVGAD